MTGGRSWLRRYAALIAVMTWIVAAGPVAVLVIGIYRAGTASPSVASPAATRSGVTPTAQTFSQFVGTWRVHGSTVQINADLTGSDEWNAGPCGPAALGLMCTGRASLVFTIVGNQVSGKVITVAYHDERGRALPGYLPDGQTTSAGDTFTLERVDADVLKRTWNSTAHGNPYLCGPAASKRWQAECGA